MRIIHTSDWHLGQYFFTKSRAAEHQAFLHWLIEQIKEHQVDALIVAGDIFDTGAPPSYARELYNRFIVELQPTACQLVVLGGNHDSVATLNESRDLLSYLNTSVISCTSRDLKQQVIILKNRQQQPAAVLCAIPFLRPRDLVTSQAGESGDQKQQALQEAIAGHYQTLYQRALELRSQLGLPLPIIATGHLTTVGVTTTDSVRDIYIGTLDAFPAQAFPPADYIALGHIHRAQQVAKTEHIRYSGSPIALSFDELSKEKSVYLVEFDQQNLSSVTPLFIPQFQPMQLIKGDLRQIEQQLAVFAGHEGLPVWLDIEVATQDYLTDIQRRIQALAADLPVEVVLLRRSKEQRNNSIHRQEKETLNELTVSDVFERRLALEADLSEPRQQRMRQMFNYVVDEIAQDGSNGVAEEPAQ
ncbi:exonuclease subunit SbcD [Yersinia pseudotuberculosis]|uniref:exonuclease subunit SbcD n=1 Tax=Yersinia pseudotuberculosis TaxID=633 RepID=UPI000348E9D9|nr:exonuclease subunit SbcD [Yersinia pseudotuberculosis]QES97389.1 exonuclease subunit SbcD [Yersinia pseudotuberculosis]CFU85372.1 exonuclease subunit SbcD [Yersinia pseudotuberculosis]CNB17720.1 exonuclease subunit SbcD [Yersinia pseudotuberculosis]CNB26553.1 exonuclease subunit SbcD [Yersinia pseudotuberculosis]CRY58023.1 exonuclease subunit SbcD [Yersinia pseudotuberculosis]